MITQPQLALSEQEENDTDVSETELVFLIESKDEFSLRYPFSHRGFPEFFKHQIARRPSKLIVHVQRIFYCYQENLADQLYAALVDLLIALRGDREGLGLRMFHGAKHKLNDKDRKVLAWFFRNPKVNVHRLPINIYSVLSTGKIGVTHLIETHNKVETVEHDPLMLARDFIEYSQLQEARAVLEEAIDAQPENQAIHEELLGLYQSTRDQYNFQRMYKQIKAMDNPMLHLWDQLKTVLEE